MAKKQKLPVGYRRATSIDRAVEIAQRWWPVMTTVYGLALAAYANAKSWYEGFTWLDALLFGFVGALILTFITLWTFVGYRKLRPLVPPARDRADFLDETVNLSDLVAHAPLIHGKTFVRCLIRGPGQIKLQSGVTYLFCSTPEKNIVEVPAGSNITGAVIAVNCTFVECHFDVAIVGTPTDIAAVRGAVDTISRIEWEDRYAELN
jgi:hypothetical protein